MRRNLRLNTKHTYVLYKLITLFTGMALKNLTAQEAPKPRGPNRLKHEKMKHGKKTIINSC